MNSRRLWICAVAIGAPVALVACGGGSGSASSSTSTTAPAGRAAQSSAFTACLKQHGVTLPAGGFGGKGSGPGGPGGATGTPPTGPIPSGAGGAGLSSKDQAAFSACRSKLPNGGQFGGGGASTQAFQAYTSCLSDHGVKVPTSTSTSGGLGGPAGLGALRSDPKFAAANKICAALLPTRGGSTTTTTPGER